MPIPLPACIGPLLVEEAARNLQRPERYIRAGV